MIRFVYPNAKAREKKFIGCGRFSVISAEKASQLNKESLRPNIGTIEEVMQAVEILAPESYHTKKVIIEEKDDSELYDGDSMGLAYLLSMIHRSRKTIFDDKGDNNSHDIWCTGKIDIHDGKPYIRQVTPPGFAIKVKAFIEEDKSARLFIVPAANADLENELIAKNAKEKKIRLLSFKDIKKDKKIKKKPHTLFKEKTILKLNGEDLSDLIKFLFISPPSKLRTYLTIVIIFAVLAGYLILRSGFLENPDIVVKKEAQKAFVSINDFLRDQSPPFLLNAENLPDIIKIKKSVKCDGYFILNGDYNILGTMIFSHINSARQFILDAKGVLSQVPENKLLAPMELPYFNDLQAADEARAFWKAIKKSIESGLGNAIFDNSHLPGYYKKNKDIIYEGKFIISFGKVKGKFYFSHKNSQTRFILHDNGKIEMEKPDNFVDPITQMPFVWICGGCFEMGCNLPENSDCTRSESPAHIVCLDGFWISRYEVTQKMWKKIMDKNKSPSFFSGCGDDCPVKSVSWNQVQDFIKRLNIIKRLNNKHNNGFFRLPKETEWEFTCRHNSDLINGNSKNPYPVCKNDVNKLGICGMESNVQEWCDDIFEPDIYSRHRINNPDSGKTGSERVVRGASWASRSSKNPCKDRFHYKPDEYFGDLGFRLIWEPIKNGD